MVWMDSVENGRDASAMKTTALIDSSALSHDPTALRRRGERDGYVFLTGLLASEDVLAARDVALDACHRSGWLDASHPVRAGVARADVPGLSYDDQGFADFQQEMLPHPAFQKLAGDRRILDVLAAVSGGPVRHEGGDVCRVVLPHTPDVTTGPHQDGFYLGAGERLWTVWVPLGDCPIDGGPLAVLPGSHRRGLQDHAPGGGSRGGVTVAAEEVWATVDMAAGDVLAFNGLTLHRACENRGTRVRLSADYRFVAERSS